MFSSQDPVLSYIKLDNITTALTQFTFTTWFKFSVGLENFNLLSYRTSDQIDVLNAQFIADSQSVDRFLGRILQHKEM